MQTLYTLHTYIQYVLMYAAIVCSLHLQLHLLASFMIIPTLLSQTVPSQATNKDMRSHIKGTLHLGEDVNVYLY